MNIPAWRIGAPFSALGGFCRNEMCICPKEGWAVLGAFWCTLIWSLQGSGAGAGFRSPHRWRGARLEEGPGKPSSSVPLVPQQRCVVDLTASP